MLFFQIFNTKFILKFIGSTFLFIPFATRVVHKDGGLILFLIGIGFFIVSLFFSNKQEIEEKAD